MNEITKYQPQLPVIIQRQLDQQRNQMNRITGLTMEALGEQSNVYSFAAFEALRTLNAMVQLKQTFAKTGMPPETEVLFEKLTQDYLEAMAQVPHRSCEMLQQVLERAAVPLNDGGWLGVLLDAFIGHANE